MVDFAADILVTVTLGHTADQAVVRQTGPLVGRCFCVVVKGYTFDIGETWAEKLPA
jgi:hypothetical protein